MNLMQITQLFTKTSKTAPAEETSKNAQLLLRAGYIHKEMAGVYAYLPLGLRVLNKIRTIVREEMNQVGSQELIMTNLQPRETWEATRRWDDAVVDVWFKTKLKDETELGLAWSHEEPILKMMQKYVSSYKDLGRELAGSSKGISVYQFQTKLRNELRAKAGIMRGREFVMKDAYSLHSSQADLDEYYEKVKEAYVRIFDRLGLGDDTYVTFASGGAFTKFSHEFQTVCEAGEDWLYLDREQKIGVNEEVLDDAVESLGLNKDKLEKVKSAEVGNIFNFGSEKAEQMGIYYTDENDQKQPIYLASYGVGITRAMGVIAEKFSDEKGLVWPVSVAPFKVYLVQIGDSEGVARAADALYKKLTQQGIEVLWDDRNSKAARAGEKFADSELIGLPWRITISERLIAGNKLELTNRGTGESEVLTTPQVFDKLKTDIIN